MNNRRQTNKLFTILILVIALLIPQWIWAQTASRPLNGDGTADNPYQITKAEELAWFRDQVNGGSYDICAKIADDVEEIDMSAVCHPADETKNVTELSWEPIGIDIDHAFEGSFDGNGKIISNLYINTSKQFAGFFGVTYSGVIKDITFRQAKVENKNASSTGILAGRTVSTVANIKTLADCSVNGVGYTGGIAGYVDCYNDLGISISNCENHATVNGTDTVGGIMGWVSRITLTSCANYGAVSGSENPAGGIAGFFSSGTIQDCANYGVVNATYNVGGIVGYVDQGKIKNVLGYGEVNATSNSSERCGLIIGYSIKGTAEGVVAFNSEAKLTYISGGNKTELEARAFGDGNLTNNAATGFTTELLSSGAVAYLLQNKASEGAAWGQLLGTDAYPTPGSENTVYPVGTVTLNCLGKLTGELTNTQPAQEGTFTMQHSSNPTHHKRVESTCTQDGNIEYWTCDICNKNFSDEQMTQEVQDVVLSASGHDYDSNDVCTGCHHAIQFVSLGNNAIQIGKVTGGYESINGYNLYKYEATADGTLTVETQCSADTYGTLWASPSASSYLCGNYDSGSNFKLTWQVTKGTVYYIGARRFSGDAIDGDVNLYITLNGMSSEQPEGLTGQGTEKEPFVIKTAEHLAWFRDRVNGGSKDICAKIADDVEEIDMSAVCHPADETKNVTELSWEPIGIDEWHAFKGSFDGNGKTISNLYINTSKDYVGLFGYTFQNVIKDITFRKAKVENKNASSTGILAGGTCSTVTNIKTLTDCSVNGGRWTGGIAGFAHDDISISNCENHATVNGTSFVGGIIGYFESETIQDCANYGVVNATYSVGGIAGFVDRGKIKNVLGYGDVNATGNFSENCGLIIGYSDNGTAEGVVAFNSEAKLTYISGANKTELEACAFGGESNLKNDIDNVKSCDKTLLASGAVAYLLNGSISTPAEGETLRWYQKLGDNADAYPVLTSTGENTVHHGKKCDEITDVYTNDASIFNEDGVLPHIFHIADQADDNGLYGGVCENCNESSESVKFIKDFCGEHGNNIKLTVGSDGSYTATEAVSISDATPYDSPVDFIAPTLNYTRSYLGDNKWQAVYVPFDAEAADWTDNGITAASINNFHEYELEDGSYETVLEVKKATSGVFEANTPYVVRNADNESITITITDAKLHKAESKTHYCMSMTRRYDFTGTYEAKSGLNADKTSSVVYVLTSTGNIEEMSPSDTLDPQRWYLTVSARSTSGVQQTPAPMRSIRIDMIGEGDGVTTGIDNVQVITTQCNGAGRQGIYDMLGRKLSQEPTHGIYIKNGKKYVK